MPELPEVETIMRGISPFLEGATIKKLNSIGQIYVGHSLKISQAV